MVCKRCWDVNIPDDPEVTMCKRCLQIKHMPEAQKQATRALKDKKEWIYVCDVDSSEVASTITEWINAYGRHDVDRTSAVD